MKVLCVTDLQGVVWKYQQLLPLARQVRAEVVINCGCLFPSQENCFEAQRDFAAGMLKEHFADFESAGVYYLYCPGLLDFAVLDKILQQHCQGMEFVGNLGQRRWEIKGFGFVGSSWSVDTEHPCKDRCRRDANRGAVIPRAPEIAVRSSETGIEKISDWTSAAMALPCLGEELDSLPRPPKESRCVYIIQSPPTGIGLNEGWAGLSVGSESVHRFLHSIQPLLAVHAFGAPVAVNFKAKLGRTFCIQPGQDERDLVYMVVDLSILNVTRYRRSP